MIQMSYLHIQCRASAELQQHVRLANLALQADPYRLKELP